MFFFPLAFSFCLKKFYGTEFDYDFIVDCLNTDKNEVLSYLSASTVCPLVMFVAVMFGGAFFLGKIPLSFPRKRMHASILGAILLILVCFKSVGFFVTPSGIMFSAPRAAINYLSRDKKIVDLLVQCERQKQDFERVPEEISKTKSPPLVVLHIGESARADHASFNGYERNTTPNLLREQQSGNLLSFPKCVSFAHKTPMSVRGILSPSTVLDNAFRHPTFIPVLNQNGVETFGLFSSSSDGGFYQTATFLTFSALQNFISTEKFADDLLPQIAEKFAEIKNAPPKERFFLYYGEGSHIPFERYNHEKFSVFKPSVFKPTVFLGLKTSQTSINKYDNTFVAMDDFCSNFLNLIRNENAVYIFVGDHGEMLGENGIWGRPFKEEGVRHVLFFVWCSEKFKTENPAIWKTLVENQRRLEIISHDFVYNSILHLFSLKTPFYDEKSDLFSESAEAFPTEMPEAESFGPFRFGENISVDF